MDYGIYLDIIMIVLLLVTICYAWMLSRRLAAFRRGREEMQIFLADFNAANERAETSIRSLRDLAEQSGGALRDDIEKARSLKDDLSFMIDRGESIADRLEMAAKGAGQFRRNELASASGKPAYDSVGGLPAKISDDVIDDRIGVETRAEELAARMVRDVERGNGPKFGAGDRSNVGMGRANDSYGDGFDEDDVDAERSEAERELLAALRSVR